MVFDSIMNTNNFNVLICLLKFQKFLLNYFRIIILIIFRSKSRDYIQFTRCQEAHITLGRMFRQPAASSFMNSYNIH